MTDDELLSPGPSSANDGLRAELLDRTARRVRLAGRARIAARVAVCLACFAAGAGLGVSLRPDLRPAPQPQVVYVEVPVAPGADAPGSPQEPPAAARTASPSELELQAEQASAKAEAARLFRAAGDGYLRDYADYRAALRCYRNYLDEAIPDALAVSPDDTWLLTSLKRARAQEKTQ
jgi:hypothetical protein